MHYAEDRYAIFDQRNVDGEVVMAADEFAGAVQRIDQYEAPAADVRDAAGSDFFLGNDGNVAQLASECVEKSRVRRLRPPLSRATCRLSGAPLSCLVDVDDHAASSDRAFLEEFQNVLPVTHLNRAPDHILIGLAPSAALWKGAVSQAVVSS